MGECTNDGAGGSCFGAPPPAALGRGESGGEIGGEVVVLRLLGKPGAALRWPGKSVGGAGNDSVSISSVVVSAENSPNALPLVLCC